MVGGAVVVDSALEAPLAGAVDAGPAAAAVGARGAAQGVDAGPGAAAGLAAGAVAVVLTGELFDRLVVAAKECQHRDTEREREHAAPTPDGPCDETQQEQREGGAAAAAHSEDRAGTLLVAGRGQWRSRVGLGGEGQAELEGTRVKAAELAAVAGPHAQPVRAWELGEVALHCNGAVAEGLEAAPAQAVQLPLGFEFFSRAATFDGHPDCLAGNPLEMCAVGARVDRLEQGGPGGRGGHADAEREPVAGGAHRGEVAEGQGQGKAQQLLEHVLEGEGQHDRVADQHLGHELGHEAEELLQLDLLEELVVGLGQVAQLDRVDADAQGRVGQDDRCDGDLEVGGNLEEAHVLLVDESIEADGEAVELDVNHAAPRVCWVGEANQREVGGHERRGDGDQQGSVRWRQLLEAGQQQAQKADGEVDGAAGEVVHGAAVDVEAERAALVEGPHELVDKGGGDGGGELWTRLNERELRQPTGLEGGPDRDGRDAGVHGEGVHSQGQRDFQIAVFAEEVWARRHSEAVDAGAQAEGEGLGVVDVVEERAHEQGGMNLSAQGLDVGEDGVGGEFNGGSDGVVEDLEDEVGDVVGEVGGLADHGALAALRREAVGALGVVAIIPGVGRVGDEVDARLGDVDGADLGGDVEAGGVGVEDEVELEVGDGEHALLGPRSQVAADSAGAVGELVDHGRFHAHPELGDAHTDSGWAVEEGDFEGVLGQFHRRDDLPRRDGKDAEGVRGDVGVEQVGDVNPLAGLGAEEGAHQVGPLLREELGAFVGETNLEPRSEDGFGGEVLVGADLIALTGAAEAVAAGQGEEGQDGQRR